MSALDLPAKKATAGQTLAKAWWLWCGQRPTRLATFGLWLSLAATSSLATLPLVGVALHALLHHPGLDQALFQPGGLLLLEVLRQEASALEASLVVGAIALVALAPLLLFVIATLYSSLARPALSLQKHALLGLKVTPRFLLLWLLTRGAQALAITLTAFLAGALLTALESVSSERGADLILAVGAAVAAALCLGLQLLSELMRASLLLQSATLGEALSDAAMALTPGTLRLFLGWLTPLLVGTLLLIAAAYGVSALHVERSGALRPWLAALIHQLALLASCVAYSAQASHCVEWLRVRQRTFVELEVALSRALPTQVEPHDAAP
jgi:hypothetical protein